MSHLTYADIATCVHMPIERASESLNVCVGALKQACRRCKLARWPYLQLKSVDLIIDSLARGVISSRSITADQLRAQRSAMVANGDFKLSRAFTKLRQRHFKAAFARRQALRQSLRESLLLQSGITP